MTIDRSDLPPGQLRCLEAIESFVAGHGYPPTIRELCGLLGMTINGVVCHLDALQRKGLIERRPGAARAIRLLPSGGGGE